MPSRQLSATISRRPAKKLARGDKSVYGSSVKRSDVVDSAVKRILLEIEPVVRARIEAVTAELRMPEAASVAEDPSIVLRDPVTNLALPPPRRLLYRQRPLDAAGHRADAETFLTQTWGDYTSHHLLYSEHLHLLDAGLYDALRSRAKFQGWPTRDFFFRLGILSKHHILTPPKGYERQAYILSAAPPIRPPEPVER